MLNIPYILHAVFQPFQKAIVLVLDASAFWVSLGNPITDPRRLTTSNKYMILNTQTYFNSVVGLLDPPTL